MAEIAVLLRSLSYTPHWFLPSLEERWKIGRKVCYIFRSRNLRIGRDRPIFPGSLPPSRWHDGTRIIWANCVQSARPSSPPESAHPAFLGCCRAVLTLSFLCLSPYFLPSFPLSPLSPLIALQRHYPSWTKERKKTEEKVVSFVKLLSRR